MTLFPHYQALGRERLGLSFRSLVSWVIVQNIGTGICSLFVGTIADRFGNRLVLRFNILAIAVLPIAALWLSSQGSVGSEWYWLVFATFGLTPVTIRILNNFTLELSSEPNHPRYLSTLSLFLAFPIYAAPLVGLAIYWISFDIPMIVVAGCVTVGWALTFLIGDPRHSTD